MKKLLMISICTVFIVNSYCQEQKKDEIPAVAKSAFAAKYPKAEKVKWSVEKPGEYEAEFKLNGTEMSALYDSKGNFLALEVEIKESELPQSVKASISKDLAGYKLDEVEKVTTAKGLVSYEIEAKKGKEKYEISFDANGKLLKKELDNEKD